jgi:2-polyprenyl-6-methoxyphenol hydroxylase-like FAD-dependent oxidoreductase
MHHCTIESRAPARYSFPDYKVRNQKREETGDTMLRKDPPEVLIVGAGPVGLFSALALTRRNVRAGLLDTGLWPCTHSYALALHPQTLKLLEEFGLADRAIAGSYSVKTLGLYDRAGRHGGVRLDSGGHGLAVARQDSVEALLEVALDEAGVQVAWRHEATRILPTPDAVEVTVSEYEQETRGYIIAHSEWVVARTKDLRVPFVIGADGYNSRVRRAAGIQFPEVGEAQYFAVFEFETDFDFAGEMRLILNEHTSDVLWPLPGGACRWSFELPGYHDTAAELLQQALARSMAGPVPSERIKDREPASPGASLPELEEGRLHELIRERAPWFDGVVRNIVWKNVVRFERRLASSFGQGRLWLAGDSAHLTSPVGIQSMNVGFAEANALSGAIARVLRGGAGLRELEQYGQQSLQSWRKLQGLQGEPTPTGGANPWIAARAARFPSSLPAHGAELDQLAAELGLRF